MLLSVPLIGSCFASQKFMLLHNYPPWWLSHISWEVGSPTSSSSSTPVSPSLKPSTGSESLLQITSTDPPGSTHPWSLESLYPGPLNNLITSHRELVSFLPACSSYFLFLLSSDFSTTSWASVINKKLSPQTEHISQGQLMNTIPPNNFRIFENRFQHVFMLLFWCQILT